MYILVKDDYAIYRKGISVLLKENFPEFNIIEANSDTALKPLLRAYRCELVFISIIHQDPSSVLTIKQLRQLMPGAVIVAMSSSSNPLFITGIIAAGAALCLYKDCSEAEFTTSVQKLINSRIPEMVRA